MEKITCLYWLLAFALTVAFVAAQDGNGDLKFNCNRRGAKCYHENSTCDAMTGQCVCADGLGNYDCRYNTSMVMECEQTLVCLKEGVCTGYTSDVGSLMQMCHCPEQYLGPDCAKNRVEFECSHDSVKVTVAPAMGLEGLFEGLIYVKDHPLSEECKLPEVYDGPQTYEATLMYEDCGKAYEFVNAENKTTRGFTIIVAYQGDVITDLDEAFNVYCIFPQNGENVEASLDAIAKGVVQDPIEAGSKEEDLSPLLVSFLDEAGELLSPGSPPTIGDVANMQFQLNAGDIFSTYRIDQIVAHNGKEPPKEVYMVQDGCVPNSFSSLVSEFSETEDGITKTLTYKTFQFLDSNKVVFRYVVRFCSEEMMGQCNKTECNSTLHLTDPEESFNAGRRKRQAAEDGVEVRELETTILVQLPARFGEIPTEDGTMLVPSGSGHQPSIWSPAPRDCSGTFPYVVVVVVLAVLLVVVGGICLVLCVRSQDKKRNGAGGEYENRAFHK